MILLIILLIFIYLLVFNKSKTKIKEGYYQKLNKNFDQCASLCKTGAGCYGFGYDQKNNKCYLSKILLTDNFPQDQHLDEYLTYDIVYEKDYRDTHKICNKLNTIKDVSDNILNTTQKSNATFFCKIKNKPEEIFIHDNDKMNLITLDQIKKYKLNDNYITKNIDWAKTGITEEELKKQNGQRPQFYKE